MKRIILIILFTLFPAAASASEAPVDIKLNGERLFHDTEIILSDGRVYAPVRFISRAFSCQVDWDGQNVLLEMPGLSAKIPVGKTTATVNGKTYSLTNAAWIADGRTYLPIRSIAELFGAEVSWDNTKKSVLLTHPDITVPEDCIDRSYSDDDLDWLSKIVHAEAQGEEHTGKIAVANVVLNRVQSSEFPDSVYDVIFDRRYGVQFTPTANGAIYNNPLSSCVLAAKEALYGASPVGECLYFFNDKIAASSWISQNRSYYTTIGNHKFYL
mgnify:CR=1 FL=1